MKLYVPIITVVLLLVFAGCAPGTNQSSKISTPSNGENQDNHMNCSPEQKTDGCDLAKDGNNNAGLFGNDFSDSVATETVLSPDPSGGVSGFIAKPKTFGKYPGIVMIHEWWGLNENIKEMAQILASEGYVVFAVDLYGEVATTPEKARELNSQASGKQAELTSKMRAAVTYLRAIPEVDDTNIGSIGWCFGGGQSLQLALSGEGMNATVIYYGRVTTNETQLSKVTWPMLGIFGEKDQSIPVDSVKAFDSALDKLGIENEIIIYPGVGHAFANPSGAAYSPNETKDAWEKTVAFFDRKLKT